MIMIKKIFIHSFTRSPIHLLFCCLLGIVLFFAPLYAKNKTISVYPNPWIPESGKSLTDNNDQMKHGSYTADGWIKFKGVTATSGNLKIYDITGKLVRNKNWTIDEEKSVPIPQTSKEQSYRDTIVHWDGRDNDYNYVESGVYIWILREANGKKHDGKVVVVR